MATPPQPRPDAPRRDDPYTEELMLREASSPGGYSLEAEQRERDDWYRQQAGRGALLESERPWDYVQQETDDPETTIVAKVPAWEAGAEILDKGVAVPAGRGAAPSTASRPAPTAAAAPKTSAGKNYARDLAEASERVAEAERTKAAVKIQGLQREDEAMENRLGMLEEERTRRAAEIEALAGYRRDAQERIDDIAMLERYPGMEEDRVRHHVSVVDSQYTTPEQKKRSQAALQQAQEIGDKRSMGAKILGAIAIALGAYGASMTGGPNRALGIVNNAIDLHIKQQRDEHARRGKAYGKRRTLYAQLMEKFDDDEEAAETAMRSIEQKKAAAKARQLAARGGQPEAAASGEALAASIEAEGVKNASVAGSDYAKRRQAADKQNLASRERAETRQEEKRGRTVVGWEGTAFDKKSHEEARVYSEAESKMEKLARNIIANRGRVENWIPFSATGDATNRDIANLIVVMKTMDKMGANFTEMERKLISEQSAAGAREFGWVADRLETLISNSEERGDEFMRNRGYTKRTGTAPGIGFAED